MRVDQLERGSPVDVWLLKTHGMYRILITKDEDCLYRAIAEQKCPGQNYYEKVKKKLRDFHAASVANRSSFELLEVEEKIKVVSAVYRRNIILYGDCDTPPKYIGKYGGTKATLRLRFDSADQSFESIHPIEHMRQMALCQSLVYELLYEKVFGISKETQSQTVHKVRQKTYNHHQSQKSSLSASGIQAASSSFSDTSGQSSDTASSPQTPQKSTDDQTSSISLDFPPFPFRVAKSLDPAFYRNAQYDIYLDAKKEKEMNVNIGDKVKMKDATQKEVKGHVQALINEDKLEVYIETPGSGEKVIVNKSDVFKISQKLSIRTSGVKPAAEKMNTRRMSTTPTKSSLSAAASINYALPPQCLPRLLPPQRNLLASLNSPNLSHHFQPAPSPHYMLYGQPQYQASMPAIAMHPSSDPAIHHSLTNTLPQQRTIPSTQFQIQRNSAVHDSLPSSQYIMQHQMPMGHPSQLVQPTYIPMPTVPQYSQPDFYMQLWNPSYPPMTQDHAAVPLNRNIHQLHDTWAGREFANVGQTLVPRLPPNTARTLQQQ